MYDIIMQSAQADIAADEAAQRCSAPIVFAARSDGYDRWAAFAAVHGRAADWRAWSEDEPCSQRNVTADTAAPLAATAYCSLQSGGGGGSCTDAFEPDNSRGTAHAAAGTTSGLAICAADDDWYAIAGGGTVRIEFTHA